LLEKKGIPVLNSEHHTEHSIEVQLPFLQFVSSDRIADVRIAAVMIADSRFEKWGKIIKEAIEETGRKVCVVCSSDFTHYGPNYGYVPFEEDIAANMKKLDTGAVDFILKQDAKGFLEYTEKKEATICGRHGIAVLAWLMKNLAGQKKGELLKYYTSGDVLGNHDNAVGYAAIVFR
jgi:AmmeMemoRadiSam system protein B